jgi:hypothetical protein
MMIATWAGAARQSREDAVASGAGKDDDAPSREARDGASLRDWPCPAATGAIISTSDVIAALI